MVFPFPTKPSDDLRALFKYQRLKEHAQDLKFSSIGPGGSLDIVNSSGTVVASFGDVGSGQGIGLRDSGAVRDVRSLFADVGRMSDAEGRLDSHASRLGSAEGRLDSHASRIGSAENGISSLGTRMGNAEGRLDSHASRIGATENVANGVRSEVNTARGGFGSLGARLNDHVSRIGSLENRADQGIAALAAQIERINTLYQRVNQILEWLNGKPGWPP